MTQNGFLGNAIRWPLEADERGRFGTVSEDQCIRQSIWLILSTARGERVMHPDFGCGIHDLVFAPNNVQTASRIESEVGQSLLTWEPRIEVLKVSAKPDTTQTNRLNIEIDYRIRSTNSRTNIVFPFYLE